MTADGTARGLVLGVGCRPGTSADESVALAEAALAEAGFDIADVRAVATIDRRLAEPGVVEAARRLGARLIGYSGGVLAPTTGTSGASSDAARRLSPTGVCEPAALRASDGGALVVGKRSSSRATVAVARIGAGVAGAVGRS
jgi:cobalamin biosynthesis protein CbiG